MGSRQHIATDHVCILSALILMNWKNFLYVLARTRQNCLDFFNIRFKLKLDGHGNGGTLINGYEGTHYELSIQATIIHDIPVACIN